MFNIHIRSAHETESGAIKDLIHAVGINPVGLDWRRFIVAVDAEDQIIATGQIKPHGRDIHELASIAVMPGYRGQGLARAIIEALLKEGPRPLYLTCIASLEPLYQKFGFYSITYEEMPRYFQRISRLVGLVFLLASREEKLLVMKLQ
jgi:N-acetylglutamate synthase-like GNAT family acetyltransferase